MFKMHSFLDLMTAKKQSQFSVETQRQGIGTKESGVRSCTREQRFKNPPNQRTIITGKGPPEGIRKHQSANLKY